MVAVTVLAAAPALRVDLAGRCASRRPSSRSQSKYASARPARCRAPRRNHADVVPQVTSGGSPFAARCRVGSSSYNDPLNKTDPLGLRPCDVGLTDPLVGDEGCPKGQGPSGPPPPSVPTPKAITLRVDRNEYAFMSELRGYLAAGLDVSVEWVDSIGCCATALDWMDGKDFYAAHTQLKVIGALNSSQVKPLLEKGLDFAIDVGLSMTAAYFCSVGFVVCLAVVAESTLVGTAAHSGVDVWFGHEVNLGENFSDSLLASSAGALCRLWVRNACLKAFGVSLKGGLGFSLSWNSTRVASIWMTKYAVDQLS